jgi:hypothetical protein
MRNRSLVTTITLAMLTLPGCGGSPATPGREAQGGSAGAGSGAGAGSAFEIDGSWLYLGPSDVPHTLTINDSTMVYSAVAGDWSSDWSIKAYDNGLHHFQVAFGSGSGTYIPVGQSMSGTYEVSGTLLTVQLAQGLASYPELQDAGTCTGGASGTPVPDCRLYIKQN